MALVVETGAGAPDAESYGSVADCAAYALARGLAFPASPAPAAEAALRRGTAGIDGRYRSRFSGRRRNGRAQALEWPRTGATDADGQPLPVDEIPVEIVHATFEAAIRELAKPGALAPDLTPAIRTKRVKAGSVETETEYVGGGFNSATTFSVIEGILSGLLGARSYFTGTAVRG
jgi:hypothetical protein